MDKAQKAIAASLVITSAIAWIAAAQQPEMMMMAAMMDASSYNPLAISLFTAIWTAGMAAMMFPAITPMVLLYNTLVTNKENRGGSSSIRSNSSVTVQQGEEESKPPVLPSRPSPSSSSSSLSVRSLRVGLFVGCYLLVWALTGIALLLGWSAIMNSTITTMTTTAAEEKGGNSSSLILPNIYGALLIIAGAYQFTPLKKTCIGYCESPMSFFMRRWKGGTSIGAVKMGVWHGMYCLGCCWPYFLLMVALGWMNLLWMGLFAGIIFAEKMWNRGGIWVARAAGVGLAVIGILVIAGMLSPSSLSSLLSSSSLIGGDSTDGDSSSSSNSGDMAMEMEMAMDDSKEADRSTVTQDDEKSPAPSQSEGTSGMKME